MYLLTWLKVTTSLWMWLDPSGMSLPTLDQSEVSIRSRDQSPPMTAHLDHLTVGLGLPEARQLSVTSSPFFTSSSEGVDTSTLGGAAAGIELDTGVKRGCG